MMSKTPNNDSMLMPAQGMTLLDHFATQAMMAILAKDQSGNIPRIAANAYLMAKAMLVARMHHGPT